MTRNNPLHEIQGYLDDSTSVVASYRAKAEVTTVRLEIDEAISNKKNWVMLYGAYNAGKSTLINALLGEEAAPVQDVPTTFQVDTYDWQGIVLLDTPGVNAPIKHEEATQEQVKRVNLMLFLMREGDQDFKDLYRRLFAMLALKKKVFIVVNHQASDDDKITLQRRVIDILLSKAREQGVNEKVIADIPIFLINLKTAYSAKKKQSERLLHHSGFSLFEEAFQQWNAQYANEKGYLERVQRMCEALWFEPTIKTIKTYLEEDAGKGRARILQDRRAILENQKKNSSNAVHLYITQQVSLLKGEVSDVFQHSKNEADMESKIQRLFAPLGKNIEDWLAHEIEQVNAKLTVKVNVGDSMHLNSDEDVSNNALTAAVYGGVKKALGDEAVLKEGLLIARKLKMPLIKGRWEQTLGAWAGKGVILVQVASFVYDIYQSNKTETERNAKEKQYAIELHQAVEKMCLGVVATYAKASVEIISSVLDEEINAIQFEIDQNIKNSSIFQKNLETLLRLRDAVMAVHF